MSQDPLVHKGLRLGPMPQKNKLPDSYSDGGRWREGCVVGLIVRWGVEDNWYSSDVPDPAAINSVDIPTCCLNQTPLLAHSCVPSYNIGYPSAFNFHSWIPMLNIKLMSLINFTLWLPLPFYNRVDMCCSLPNFLLQTFIIAISVPFNFICLSHQLRISSRVSSTTTFSSISVMISISM